MSCKLQDILKKKVNSANNQISFDFKKREAKKFGISEDDVLKILIKKENKFDF